MSTTFRMISPDKFPTRYEAFEHQGEWCILGIGDDSPAVHWLEMAVYSNQALGLHAEVRRHPTAIEGKSYVADVCKGHHGVSLLGRDFNEALALASDWLGI